MITHRHGVPSGQALARLEILTRGVHHSGYCYRIPVTPALPPIVLRYDIPPIGAILFRGLPINEPEPGPELGSWSTTLIAFHYGGWEVIPFSWLSSGRTGAYVNGRFIDKTAGVMGMPCEQVFDRLCMIFYWKPQTMEIRMAKNIFESWLQNLHALRTWWISQHCRVCMAPLKFTSPRPLGDDSSESPEGPYIYRAPHPKHTIPLPCYTKICHIFVWIYTIR